VVDPVAVDLAQKLEMRVPNVPVQPPPLIIRRRADRADVFDGDALGMRHHTVQFVAVRGGEGHGALSALSGLCPRSMRHRPLRVSVLCAERLAHRILKLDSRRMAGRGGGVQRVSVPIKRSPI